MSTFQRQGFTIQFLDQDGDGKYSTSGRAQAHCPTAQYHLVLLDAGRGVASFEWPKDAPGMLVTDAGQRHYLLTVVSPSGGVSYPWTGDKLHQDYIMAKWGGHNGVEWTAEVLRRFLDAFVDGAS